MTGPNLNDGRPAPHRDCNEYANGLRWNKNYWPGDLRRCPHGKIQIVVESNGKMQGPGSWLWANLSRISHPFAWARAKKILDIYDASA